VPGQELLCGVNAESTKETDEAIWDQEFSLEESRGDKDWSLTDCLSVIVMERRPLTEALTTDHHFEQAGMKALMLSLPRL
jgi:predicted nucleic acid-binding protein